MTQELRADKLYFGYGEKEITFLKSKDKALAKVMDEVGHVYREVIPDMFMALVNSIIGQQISTKAQITIWNRFQNAFTPVTPEHIHALPAEDLQPCGISLKKATYIKDIAADIVDGRLALAELETMDDVAVCARLSRLRGIGVWTAEMLMTFSMQRANVLSWGDFGIQRGLRMLYRHRQITPALFAKYKKRYAPYATVASLYLWALAGGACEGYSDPAAKTEAQKKAIAKTLKKKALGPGQRRKPKPTENATNF